ncbi:MAG: hypothetical protein ACR2OB_00395 [Solirubrobacteraceae bacterium]
MLLENLAGKASATLALLHLLADNDVDPSSIDYVLGAGEEAIGDRYQRGGGNLAKAVAAAAGCSEASGADVKNFCAAPVPAVVIASGLVAAGVQTCRGGGGRLAAQAGDEVPGPPQARFAGARGRARCLGAVVEADDGASRTCASTAWDVTRCRQALPIPRSWRPW